MSLNIPLTYHFQTVWTSLISLSCEEKSPLFFGLDTLEYDSFQLIASFRVIKQRFECQLKISISIIRVGKLPEKLLLSKYGPKMHYFDMACQADDEIAKYRQVYDLEVHYFKNSKYSVNIQLPKYLAYQIHFPESAKYFIQFLRVSGSVLSQVSNEPKNKQTYQFGIANYKQIDRSPMNYPSCTQLIILQEAYGVFNILGDHKEVIIFSSFATLNLMGSHNRVSLFESEVQIGIAGSGNKIHSKNSRINVKFVGYQNQVKSFNSCHSQNVVVRGNVGQNNLVLLNKAETQNQAEKFEHADLFSDQEKTDASKKSEDLNQTVSSNYGKDFSEDQTNEGEEQDPKTIDAHQFEWACKQEEISQATKTQDILLFGKTHSSVFKKLNLQNQGYKDVQIEEHRGEQRQCACCSQKICHGQDKMKLDCCHEIHLTCITDWLSKSEKCLLCFQH